MFFVKNNLHLLFMIRYYKYAIYPTKEQKEQLSKFFGSARFVYNLGLETKLQAWTSARKYVSCIDLINQMKELKDTEAKWLKECPSQTLQMSLRNLDNAYTNFFRGGGFPKFKSKHSKQSIHFPQGVKVNFIEKNIFIPKLKNVSCVFHREFKGDIKTVTVSKTSTNRYFVSILVDNQDPLPNKKPISHETTVGIDMGVKTFATLSNGAVFDNPKHLRNSLKKLIVEQRKLSRRFKKGAKEQSKSYQKQKMVVAKIHAHIKNQREDFLHKASINIIHSFDTVCLEDLNIKGMMQNKRLALAIGELGWHKFKTMLEYKSDWYGKNIKYIGRFEPSSKLCSNCGKVFKELTLKDRNWTCNYCGINHDRDCNAAKNIKIFGLRGKPTIVNVSH